ncbi:MAG: DUF2141 domain-containing protein [Spirochaetia bacterium]|nr:DUF2141 domain-containing protein [Spirochaetia bacterium]
MNKKIVFGLMIPAAVFLLNCKSAKTQDKDSNTYAFNPENRGELILKIHGMNRAKGNFMILVIPENKSGKTKFPYQKTAVAALIIPAQKKITEVIIPDLPYGRYAVAAIHDTIRNQKLDFIMGFDPSVGGVLIPILPNWPIEGYGFSNKKFGIKSVLKPGTPNFKKTSFEFSENQHTEEIHISYFWRRWGIPYIGSIIAVLSLI